MNRIRITLRDIAARCDISATAVSLALRNHPSIPESTRDRVRGVAAALNYRPDPALAALNHYRHQRATSGQGYVLAYVTCFEKRGGWQQSPFFRRVYRGAFAQAGTLGYRMEHFWLSEPGLTGERFAQVLEARGIRGMVIAPMPLPASSLELPWHRFSCVAIGPSLVSPVLNSACGDQYQAIMLALERLRLLGYRRIGLLIHPDADRRHQGKYQAAVAHTATPETPRPLVRANPSDGDLRAWLKQYKPDVVISDVDANFDRLVRHSHSAKDRVCEPGTLRAQGNQRGGDLSGADSRCRRAASAADALRERDRDSGPPQLRHAAREMGGRQHDPAVGQDLNPFPYPSAHSINARVRIEH
ncbi:MAG TPA: LacI family DNA-binding transcriptional regulator [Opitutaceae bacterium]|nr:LacI family DNA-binding transcriptional regulator [Opitutaceae bacterium]